jgi:hypothetical protein
MPAEQRLNVGALSAGVQRAQPKSSAADSTLAMCNDSMRPQINA